MKIKNKSFHQKRLILLRRMSTLHGLWCSKEYPQISGRIKIKIPEIIYGAAFNIKCTFYYHGAFRHGQYRVVLMEAFADKRELVPHRDCQDSVQLIGRSKKFDNNQQFQISLIEYVKGFYIGYYSTINPIDIGEINITP
ncbi:hypothetical protein BH23THE1_BH23THE1_33110 [soil metagenome]